MTNLVGTVIGKSESGSGYMVEVFTAGQWAIYGPMNFIAPPVPMADIDHDPFIVGDQVFIMNYQVRDQFVIVGRYMNVLPEIVDPPVHSTVGDEDGDAIIDGIEGQYEEEAQP